MPFKQNYVSENNQKGKSKLLTSSDHLQCLERTESSSPTCLEHPNSTPTHQSCPSTYQSCPSTHQSCPLSTHQSYPSSTHQSCPLSTHQSYPSSTHQSCPSTHAVINGTEAGASKPPICLLQIFGHVLAMEWVGDVHFNHVRSNGSFQETLCGHLKIERVTRFEKSRQMSKPLPIGAPCVRPGLIWYSPPPPIARPLPLRSLTRPPTPIFSHTPLLSYLQHRHTITTMTRSRPPHVFAMECECERGGERGKEEKESRERREKREREQRSSV